MLVPLNHARQGTGRRGQGTVGTPTAGSVPVPLYPVPFSEPLLPERDMQGPHWSKL
jgi:hypothetical protein